MLNLQHRTALVTNIIMRTPIARLYRYSAWVRRLYWDLTTSGIIRSCRSGEQARADYPIYYDYLRALSPRRLLDIGCGSGRLFPLFSELNIPRVVGVDISPYAISKIEKHYRYIAKVLDVRELNYPPDYFDVAVSNAVLRHIPPKQPIKQAVSKIKEQCQAIILREVVRGREFSYDFRHNYESLFCGWRLVKHYEDGVADVFIFVKRGGE